MNQRGFTPLYAFLGIILVAGLVGGAYYLGKGSQSTTQAQPVAGSNPTQVTAIVEPTPTATPDPTANWKIYSNQKYGYSVKYPNNLKLNEFETSYAQYVEFTLGRDALGNAYLANYTIAVSKEDFQAKNAASVNFLSADWVKSFYEMGVGDNKTADTVTFKKLASEKLAGQDSTVVKVSASGVDQKRYFLRNKGYMYMIYDYNTPADYPLFLSTFKFIN